nr:PREDICTED: X-linked retinitis pigmentosa GTPase regulator-interacting protein 1 [Latimeria chalumnae]|eukprot:XP_014349588.1 PREDICTED: X-linked retinitis pigmentosa GTPase regulator-interacting protein 1 [Latimeria chalumnae]
MYLDTSEGPQYASCSAVGLGSPSDLDVRSRQHVSNVSREELEERFLHLHEEHLLLKQHARRQEDKIKRMATKLLRLTNERKHGADGSGRRGRDLEAEEMIEELQDKVRELEHQNEGLRNKLSVTRQQLQVQGCRQSPYGHVQSRINTGLRRVTEAIQLQEKLRKVVVNRYAQIRASVIESQNSKMAELERAAEMFRDILKTKELEFEDALHHIRQQKAEEHRLTIKENVEVIRLQKLLSEKGAALLIMEEKFTQLQEVYEKQLEESQRAAKAGHDALLASVEELNSQLRDERQKGLTLESQLQNTAVSQRALEEFQERIADLEKERELLKENYDKLLERSIAFEVKRESNWKTEEEQLKQRISNLEETLKAEFSKKNRILDNLSEKREFNEALKKEAHQLQLCIAEQKQEVMALLEKKEKLEVVSLREKEKQEVMSVHEKEKQEVMSLYEKAASIIKSPPGRAKELLIPGCAEGGTAVQEKRDRSFTALQAAHAETVLELEKTRDMLILQHKINKDYQEELDVIMKRTEEEKMEQEKRNQQSAHLLDLRAARIQKLEAQLRDIAYGTRNFRTKADAQLGEVQALPSEVDLDEPTSLRHGENLFELHVQGVYFTPAALRAIADHHPATFCTYAFYDFETHATPVVRGDAPVYDFTSQYAVTMDDPFLQYLQRGSMRLEVHLVMGMQYQTLAACHLHFGDVLEKHDRVYGTATLTGMRGENLGMLEFWVRLRIPVEQTLRLYKQRMKALGYASTGTQDWVQKQQLEVMRSLGADGASNELHITVTSCSSLTAHWPTPQPSPYAIYHFFNFPDHDTPIIPCSSNPQFNDHRVFSVPMTFDLERYLKFESLWIYVFDDSDLDLTRYLGKAQVPLLSLSHGKAIKGDFILRDVNGYPNGSINVTLEWKFSYLPPGCSTGRASQARPPSTDTPLEVLIKEETSLSLPAHIPQAKLKLVPTDSKSGRGSPLAQRKKMKVSPITGLESKAIAGLKKQLLSSRSYRQEERPSPPLKRAAVEFEGEEPRGGGPENKERPRTSNRIATQESDTVDEQEEQPQEASEGEQEMEQEVENEVEELGSTREWRSISWKKLPKFKCEEETEPEEADVEATESSESQATDSDDVIIHSHLQKHIKPIYEKIRIEVISLNLDPEAEVVANESVQRVYVEYRFHDVPLEQTETPMSLRKPTCGEDIIFNFSKVIYVDREKNLGRREFLSSLLEGAGPEEGRLKFTVVSDPLDEQEEECQDIGFAYLDVRQILMTGCNIIEEELDILCVQNEDMVIGSLKVSMEAAEALQDIHREFRGAGTL